MATRSPIPNSWIQESASIIFFHYPQPSGETIASLFIVVSTCEVSSKTSYIPMRLNWRLGWHCSNPHLVNIWYGNQQLKELSRKNQSTNQNLREAWVEKGILRLLLTWRYGRLAKKSIDESLPTRIQHADVNFEFPILSVRLRESVFMDLQETPLTSKLLDYQKNGWGHVH